MRAILAVFLCLFAAESAGAAEYRLTNSGAAANAQPIVREATNSTIPNDPRNADYQAYTAWLADGGTPDPAPTPSMAQQAQTTYDVALAAGLAITSTGTPSLNATYALSSAQQQNLANVALYIAVNGRFPGGLAALALTTTAGSIVPVGATGSWQAIATAVADYVAKLDVALMTAQQGGTPSWPAASAAIP